MAFEGISEKLNDIFRRLKGRGKLSEADVKAVMREIKLALLAADVNFKVVKAFIANVTERAVGEEVLKSLTPAQQVIKIVNEELTELMGGGDSRLLSSCCAACRARAKRPMRRSLRTILRKWTAGRCSSPATFTGPRL